MPEVRIGDNVIIGAGSVVIKGVPSSVVAVGNPCKVLKIIMIKNVAKKKQKNIKKINNKYYMFISLFFNTQSRNHKIV